CTTLFRASAVNMVDALSAFSILIVLLTSPWMVVLMIGYVVRRGYYLVDDLQVFNRGEKGGAYWFTRGVNWRAAAAWLVAAVAGLLFANTSIIVGPFANAAGGIDISLPVTLLAAAVVYPVMLLLFPEPRGVFGPEGPRFVPARDTVIEEIRQRRSVEPTTSV